MGHPTPFCLTTTSAVLLSCECSIHANACSFSLSCLSLMQSGLSCDSSSFINTLPDMYININMFLHYHTCNLLHLAQKSIIQFPSFFWKQPHYLLWSNSYWIVTEIRKKKHSQSTVFVVYPRSARRWGGTRKEAERCERSHGLSDMRRQYVGVLGVRSSRIARAC